MNADFETKVNTAAGKILAAHGEVRHFAGHSGADWGEVGTAIVLAVSFGETAKGGWTNINQTTYSELETARRDLHLRHEIRIAIATRGPMGLDTEDPIMVSVKRSSVFFPSFPDKSYPIDEGGKLGTVTFTEKHESNYIEGLRVRGNRKFILNDYRLGDLEIDVPPLEVMLRKIVSNEPGIELTYTSTKLFPK